MKKISLAVFAMMMVAMLAVFAGCGSSSNTNGGTADSGTAQDNSLQNVLDKGTFVLGLDDSFPPMGFRDENNNIVGFDIDVATEVANRMGVELKLQPIEWSTKEMELNTGSVDCLWNGLSIDDERKQAMDLSEPYMTNRMVLVVLNDSEYTDQASLAGKTIGVQNGSTAEKILEESDFAKTIGNTIGFKDNVTAFMELETKGIDAIFMDEVVANYAITSQNKDFKVLEDGLTEEEYAVGFKKGNTALKNEVQKYIDEMKADGTMTQISEKWFGKDVVSR
ncbi:MAG: amino acid ABC transporter substrate-binding protein [Clostridium sp.]|mgnify:FL=1|nr:amino acid ABC transporter substrate-binding protein [Clostridium sp.]